MLEGDAAGAAASCDRKEVLGRDGRRFDHDRAAGGTVGDHDLFGATDQLAVDHVIGDVEVVGLQATAVGERREVGVIVGVFVGVSGGVFVGVMVGEFVAVCVGVIVGVWVGVKEGVDVGVSDGV